MLKNWRQEYAKLTDFIVNHPEVKIEKAVVRLPENVRPEFYQIFRATREEFVKENNQALLDKAEVLSKNYIQVEKEVSELLGIEDVTNFIPVDKFLNKPTDQLVVGLFNLLFDLLKDKIDIETYEKSAKLSVENAFDASYQLGYEAWMTLSIIKLLKVDETFRVEAEEFNEEELFKHGGPIVSKVPAPEKSDRLTFTHEPEVGYVVPDQTIHSGRLGKYFSFRPEIIDALGTANNRSTNREWLPVDETIELEPNVIMVYADKKLEELAIIADTVGFCRPDLIIECIGLNKSYDKDSIDRIQTYHDAYKPRLGTYIVSSEPLVNPVPEDTEVGIHYLPVGFDQSKLEKIIELFIDKGNNDK